MPLSLEPTTWYNPDLKTSTYIVPGLVGVILTMTMVMLTAMAIARERERGTLEQLIVSPLKPAELIVGKIVPYVGIGYVQITLILLLGRVVFEVPFVGSLGERVHAVIVVREVITGEALQAFCAARLSDYKVPETVVLTTDALPRNANGKVLKRQLREALT